MENIPSSVAAGNAFDDFTALCTAAAGNVFFDFESGRRWFRNAVFGKNTVSQCEVEIDEWVVSRLSRPRELQLPKPVGFVASYAPVPFCGETVTLQIGSQDVVVKHKISGGSIPNHAGGGKRGRITRLSKASIKRMKLASRNVPEGAFQAFVTLTYPDDFPTDGLKVKRDLSVFRKWLKRRGIGAFWFLEFQKRGAPHYHLFLSSYPLGGVQAVAKAWFRIVGSRDPKHLAWHLGQLSGRSCLEYVRKPHVASYYATKYAAKQEQKDVPADYANVGRFWGMFGAIRPVWRFVVGHGSQCGKVTKDLVNNFRCSFDDRAKQAYWLQKTFVSTVMWGGAAELSDIMAFVKWTPS
jgi:hypothetical protein